jgi:rod shape-determining protein MreD
MQTLRILAMLGVALALQTTVAWAAMGNRTVVDLVIVAVIYFALGTGPNAGIAIGTVAGIAQDVLSGGVLGVSGLANSLVGCASGVLGTQFIVSSTLARFVVFVLGTLAQAGIVIGVYSLIDPRGFGSPPTLILARALINGVVGVLAFQVVERTPQVLERRRYRRAHVRGRMLG